MIDLIRSYINDGIGLIQLAALLVVGWVVLSVWMLSRSVTKVIGVMIVGALVLGFIYNADWFGQRAGDDIRSRENGAAVVAP